MEHPMKTMKWLSALFATAATVFAFSAIAQAEKDIVPLRNPQPVENDGKIEVIEFFGYGCIHCAHLEPKLEEWIKRQPADVRVKRVPIEYASKGVESIPIYYTLEAMGLLDKLHQKVFDAIHTENLVAGNPAAFNKWLEKQGVDPAKYEQVKQSFAVSGKAARAKKMVMDYEIASTPTIVVNGRFAVQQPGGGNGAERMFVNIDRLIAEARKAQKPAAAAPAPVAPPKAKKVSHSSRKPAQTPRPA
jgi:protein dithiol oxidoreductase (disulfide-forming)